MTQTEYKDSYAALGETKFKFSALQETPSSQQNVFKGRKKWILDDMSPLRKESRQRRWTLTLKPSGVWGHY